MSSFFRIHPDIDPFSIIIYSNTVRTCRGCELSDTLDTFMYKIKKGLLPVGYEILYYQKKTLYCLFFDLDYEYDPHRDTIPKNLYENILLTKTVKAIIDIIGDTEIAVSEAHRDRKISFHFVFPMIISTMQQNHAFAKFLNVVKNLPIDTSVYNHRRLMRPVCCNGEKPDSVPLKPHPLYTGVFSDHIIQTPRLNAKLFYIDVNKLAIRFITDDPIQSRLAKIKTDYLPFDMFTKYLSHVKGMNMKELFTFKINERFCHLKGSGRRRIDIVEKYWTELPGTILSDQEIGEIDTHYSSRFHIPNIADCLLQESPPPGIPLFPLLHVVQTQKSTRIPSVIQTEIREPVSETGMNSQQKSIVRVLIESKIAELQAILRTL